VSTLRIEIKMVLTRKRFGLSFMGDKWSEETLIAFAYAYEQRTKTRLKVKPYIVPNTQLKDVIGK